MPTVKPAISVVMTVLNAVDTIVESVSSILRQDAFEVIVVDGGSTDGTRDKLASLSGLRLLDAPHATIGSGKNVGIRNSSGDIVAITDADVVVERNWLDSISREFDDASVGAVGRPLLTHPDSKGLAALIGEL